MKRIFVPTQSARDWKNLLAKPELHWKPGRSAMTLALAWEAAQGQLPRDVQNMLAKSQDPALADLGVLVALPEYQVDLPGGSRPSQTDLMVVATNAVGLCVLAVEGKVEEAFGPTISDKMKGRSSGQEERIKFLLSSLKIPLAAAGSLRYQLLHRTVSALITAKSFHASTAVMVVHSFGTSTDTFEDYKAFCSALNQKGDIGQVVGVGGFDQPKLYLGWCVGDTRYMNMKA